MENIVTRIPFLRLALALACGIFIASFLSISTLLLFLFIGSTITILFLLNRFYKIGFEVLFGIFTHFLFISLGILAFTEYNKKPDLIENGIFTATVLEKPQEKKNSYKSQLDIFAINLPDTVIHSNEKVLVYFEKKYSASSLEPGTQIVFKTSPQLVKNYGNPYEFDYKKYLANKRIFRQVYLSSGTWEEAPLPTKYSLNIIAELARGKLLTIYRNQNLGKNELEILSALTLGYKRELDPETKRIFSSAGAMHVLAVSGLHVGIIYWVITLILGFLRKRKNGNLIFVLFTITLLWCYAFITGLPPSVMRATAMLTIFVIGDNLKRKANTYNSLAASALFLLLINPNNLFEVGFQLSYSAVFGIVFLQPKISKFVHVENRILKFFWTLFTISIAAQIATFPLTTYYFNQFPGYFWLTNIFIIPAVMVLIPMGIFLLLVSTIPFISSILSITINAIIKAIYFILSEIEQLPLSTLELSIQPFEMICLLGIFISFFLLVTYFSARRLKVLLSCILLFIGSTTVFNINRLNTKTLILYNTENPTLQLINGKNNYLISEKKIHNQDKIITLIKQTNINLRLNQTLFLTKSDSLINEFIFLKHGTLFFADKIILFNPEFACIPDKISPDIIINPNNYKELEHTLSKNTFVITNKRYFQTNSTDRIRIHNTSKKGAFIENW